MENETTTVNQNSGSNSGFKLDWKRTIIIGFAFFGILLLWQVYDSWCPTFLTELFTTKFIGSTEEEVQYLVGIIMALDNLAALILLPIFGNLSDKTKSPLGKRMPYIIVGSVVCAIAFPFIPLCFHYNNVAGVISIMVIVVIFMMMYRNPAVSLMPDMTPKPLRSKANGIINIMGYIGGAVATILGIFLVLSDYLDETSSVFNNLWVIELPFIIASVLLVISTIILVYKIRENKIAKEVAEEMKRGEEYSELEERVEEDKPLSKKNKIMLILILAAIFFWYMADNGISTFMTNYTIYYLGASSSTSMINTIVGGVGSVIGFAVGGYIANKIGRKWSIVAGLGLTLLGYLVWTILSYALTGYKGGGEFPVYLYAIWFLKGFGMSLAHVNSYPMVVELCTDKKIGRFTGYYYAASMLAQTVTPVALGALLLIPELDFGFLPVYALVCVIAAIVVFFFVKNVKTVKTKIKTGLESMDVDD